MAVEVGVPRMGESISEVVLLEWLKAGGEYVEKGEPICVLETDKANVDLPAPEAGVLHPLKEVDESIAVGEVIARIEEGEQPAAASAEASESAEAQVEPAPEAAPVPADEAPAVTVKPTALSPAVRRLVQESGVDPSRIRGTGRGGRLIKQDVLDFLKSRETAGDGEPARVGEPPGPGTESPAAPGERREPMSRIRRRIAERLTEAQRVAAMLTTFNEVDLTEVMALRARHKERFQQKHGVSLGLMSFFSRASVVALREIPALNARIDGDDIVYQEFVNLGIAVSTERGLLVPVVRGAESLSMAGIESEIKRLAAAAREGGLALDDLSGGTFTITNGGLFGSMMSTPILTPPQTGILGMHAIKDRPVAVDGQVAVRPMMYLALTYDHRLVDGEQSVRFLVRVKELLEDPARLALEI